MGNAKRAHHATQAGRDGGQRCALPTYGSAPYVKYPVSQPVILRSAKCVSKDDGPTAADILTLTRPSVPARLLHSRAGLRPRFEPALDLGAGHREILELAVVEPVQGYARGVTLVARDHRREEAVDETAQARQQNRSSPGKWPGGGGRNGGHIVMAIFFNE